MNKLLSWTNNKPSVCCCLATCVYAYHSCSSATRLTSLLTLSQSEEQKVLKEEKGRQWKNKCLLHGSLKEAAVLSLSIILFSL